MEKGFIISIYSDGAYQPLNLNDMKIVEVKITKNDD